MDDKVIKVGIDLDNCITADQNSKEFFRIICHLLHPEYEIHIITNRDKSSRRDTVKELEELGIQYSHLELTSQKAKYILKEGINIYFDDSDTYFLSLPKSVLVLKVREEYNFDYNSHRWIGSKKNTKMIG